MVVAAMTEERSKTRTAGLEADFSVIRNETSVTPYRAVAGRDRTAATRDRATATKDGAVGTGDERFTLDLAVAVEPGRTLALLGPNGAGKSTALQAIAGLLPIRSGRIALAGRVLDEPGRHRFVEPEQRNIGIVFQDYLLFDHLSVIDNIAFGARSRGAGRKAARAEAGRWVEAFELGEVQRRRPDQISGGQAQRAAMARALAIEPDLLLLDEPLAALDVSTRTRLRRGLVDHLAGFAGPRVLITHEPSDAFVLADQVCVVEDGQVTQSGTVEQIRRHPATPYVAALTGTNFLTGHNRGGTIKIDDSTFELRTSDTSDGPVQAVINPRAVSVHRERPGGSPRNSWQTTIDWIEPIGETTRLRLAGPLPIMADITPGSAAALGLGPGSVVWVAVKATEVMVNPA